jgi:hypothetical protein
VVIGRPYSCRRSPTRDRLRLLDDLHRQLPRTRGSMRRRTEAAIRELELELAPGKAREREVVNGR